MDALRALRRHGGQSDGEQFDVIIADPPYNIGKDFGNGKDKRGSDMRPLGSYVTWTKHWVRHCFALLADDGVMYIYGFPEILAHVAVNYPLEEQRWLVWHYTNKAVPSSRFWQRSHESILCLWKPGRKRPQLAIDQIREPYTSHYQNCVGKVRRETVSRFGGARGKQTIYRAHANGALPRDVIQVPALAGGAGRAERWFLCRTCDGRVYPPGALAEHRTHETVKHPTQKPMALTRRLIRSRIAASHGRVLVPFAGSGSECVVAQELGLEFLGIEINPEYANFARQWCDAAKQRMAPGGGRASAEGSSTERAAAERSSAASRASSCRATTYREIEGKTMGKTHPKAARPKQRVQSNTSQSNASKVTRPKHR